MTYPPLPNDSPLAADHDAGDVLAPGSEMTPSSEDPSAPLDRPSGAPFSLVLGIATGLAVYATSLGPLRDIDLYWHLLAGQELAGGTSASALGRDWSYAPAPQPWTSPAWLFELLLCKVHESSGWAGIAAFRVLTAAIAVAVLAWTVLVGRAKSLAGFPYLLAMVAVTAVAQERPQQFTIIGACVLGAVLLAGLRDQVLPAWWIVAPATVVWANLHGGWILMPFVLILVALALLLEKGRRCAAVWRAFGLSILAMASGCLTPSGIDGLAAPIRLTQVGVRLAEWQATQPTEHLGLTSIAMLALFLIGWSGSKEVPRGEAAAVLVVLVFMWMAWRNLPLGLALLAPLAAHRLVLGFPAVGRPEPRWSAPIGILAALLLTATAVFNVSVKPNLPTQDQPIALAGALAALPSGQRVLNEYNTSGIVLYFGGEGTQTGVDGRADRYSPEYLKEYSGLMKLRGDWSELLDSLAPTSALLRSDSPLAHVLQEERGWEVVREERGWVLLGTRSGSRP